MNNLSSSTPPNSKKEISVLAKGASVTLLGKMGGRGFHTIGQILLARMLGPKLFGLYALGWTILNMVALVAPLGLQNGVIHFGAPLWQKGERGRSSLITRSLGFALLAGTMLGVGMYGFAPWATGVFKKPELLPVLQGFSLALPFIAGLRVAAAATRLSERMEFSMVAEDLIQPLSNLVFVVLLWLLGAKLLPSVIVGTGSFALAGGVALYFVWWIFPTQNGADHSQEIGTRTLLRYSAATTFSGLFTMLTLWADRLLVGYYLPSAEVGVYQVASQTAMFFGIVLTAFNTIFTPMIARLYYAGEKTQLEEMFKISTKWGLYLSLPFFIVIVFAAKKVMTTVYGYDYGTGGVPLLILSVAQLVNAGTGAVGFMLNMTGHPKRWVSASGFMLGVSVLLNVWLIPRFGIVGAAWGTGTSVAGLFMIGVVEVRRNVGFWPYDRRYLKGGLAALSACLAVYLVGFLPVSDLLYLGIATTMGGFVFIGVLVLAGLDEEDKEILKMLRKRILPG